MNRKISTLFTAGLLMAGSLCGSAWAQSSIQQLAGFVNGQGTFTATPATELKAGHQYVFVNDQTNNEAYGHELSGSTITESTIGLSTPLADNDDVKQYVWTVGITESPKGFFSYNFTNVETGKLLRVNVGFTAIEKNTKVEDKNTNKDFVFDGSSVSALTGGAYSGTNNNLYIYSSSTPLNGLNWGSNVSTVSTTIAAPIFYEVKSELLTNSEELNALYNTSGFSFVSKRLKDQGEEPIGNLFNDKMVVARYLARPITIDATQYPGYSGSSSDLQIPAGMYFFTKNAPALDNSDQVVRDYNALLGFPFARKHLGVFLGCETGNFPIILASEANNPEEMYKVYLYYPYHTLIPLFDGYNGSRLQNVCVLVRKRYLLISGLSVPSHGRYGKRSDLRCL